MTASFIGPRLKALREKRELTKRDTAKLLRLAEPELHAMENGAREISPDELMLAVENLGEDIDYFIDPFSLVGNERFSWRQTGVTPDVLSGFERKAGGWLAAYRVLSPMVGVPLSHRRTSLSLTESSRYEDAWKAGDRFAADHDLGEAPATRLVEVMEHALGVLVLMVDAPDGISGAACRLPEMDAVLINRRETIGRRSFNLAHELFHILTWENIPPDQAGFIENSRVERLANNFASSLLMPTDVLKKHGEWSALDDDALIRELNMAADRLRVTTSALRLRLSDIGMLERSRAKNIDNARIRINGRRYPYSDVPPPLLSKGFLEVLSRSLDQGIVSMRRSARLLDMTFDEVAGLLGGHGLESDIEL